MSTALAVPEAPAVTSEQLELIKRTVANGATADELKLYLFDCARQGVHPLDKLVHFVKRQGKYTPITSIDFMRIRAAETNEYAGSDDAVFSSPKSEAYPELATITVWRLVQSTRCAFTATARWAEYCPEPGPSGKADVMWRRMPHTMLAKCAEALALRKGFPRQLAGLYAREEMDQADGPRNGGYVVEAPGAVETPKAAKGVEATAAKRVDPNAMETSDVRPDRAEMSGGTVRPSDSNSLPAGVVYITKVEAGRVGGKAKGWLHTSAQLPGSDGFPMFDDRMVGLASEYCQTKTPVRVLFKTSTTSGKDYVQAIKKDVPPAASIDINADLNVAPITVDDIPFESARTGSV